MHCRAKSEWRGPEIATIATYRHPPIANSFFVRGVHPFVRGEAFMVARSLFIPSEGDAAAMFLLAWSSSVHRVARAWMAGLVCIGHLPASSVFVGINRSPTCSLSNDGPYWSVWTSAAQSPPHAPTRTPAAHSLGCTRLDHAAGHRMQGIVHPLYFPCKSLCARSVVVASKRAVITQQSLTRLWAGFGVRFPRWVSYRATASPSPVSRGRYSRMKPMRRAGGSPHTTYTINGNLTNDQLATETDQATRQ